MIVARKYVGIAVQDMVNAEMVIANASSRSLVWTVDSNSV